MLMAVQDGANVQGWIPHPQGTRGSTLQKALSPKRLIPCMGLKTRSKDSQAVLNVEREYLLGMIDKKMSWHPRSTVQLPPLPPRPCHPYLPPPPGEYEEAGGRS